MVPYFQYELLLKEFEPHCSASLHSSAEEPSVLWAGNCEISHIPMVCFHKGITKDTWFLLKTCCDFICECKYIFIFVHGEKYSRNYTCKNTISLQLKFSLLGGIPTANLTMAWVHFPPAFPAYICCFFICSWHSSFRR